LGFASNFVWGAATSSYQIEGGWNADGKAPSVWDTLCRREGMIYQGHTGDVAADHYHRSAEDVGLMREIGLRAYRFSISWPRVLPEGVGRVNEAGLGFYDRLVDQLLAAGVTPYVTLFHWDYPQALHERGSWLNRESVAWFEEFTRVIVSRLSDRVRHWMTINEPQIFLGPTEGEGFHPPGNRLSHRERLLAAHHTLMAHGRSVQVIRAEAKSTPSVGWALVGRIKVPDSASVWNYDPSGPTLENGGGPTETDIDAARRQTLAVKVRDFWTNTWFADPAILGHYPEDGVRLYGADMPTVRAGDMETIHQPLDFYGMNVYDAEVVRAGPGGEPQTVAFPPGHPQNALRWFLVPQALYWGSKFLFERYKTPLYVTENGFSGLDWVDTDGKVRDYGRIDYTRRYLTELARASGEGVDIRGYFHWSLLDNFEWQQGYKERFGLIHVDFATLKRTLKESARWYAGVIASNGADMSVR
jgi:beta-glucosidase